MIAAAKPTAAKPDTMPFSMILFHPVFNLELYVVCSKLLSDDLFKIALGAALAATNLNRHPPDDRPSDPSLPPDDGICKSEPCLECRHAPTAGNIGTPRAGSPEIAFIKRHLSYGSCWN